MYLYACRCMVWVVVLCVCVYVYMHNMTHVLVGQNHVLKHVKISKEHQHVYMHTYIHAYIYCKKTDKCSCVTAPCP